MCTPVELVFIENLGPYNLIKVEFNPVDSSEGDPEIYDRIMLSNIEYVGRNPYHRWY